ncbi:YxlC family protein [Paenibacillus sp. MBLB4367]|uniref:YxlC family protein n=1 Tax=Paenibacillus sp. MBLB4367 TaxID=3384767 RepID=UPI0039082475
MNPKYPKSGKSSEESLKPVTEDETLGLEEDREIIQRMQNGLEHLERSVPVFPPSLAQLGQQLAEHRQTLRRRLYRDLAIFMIVAVCILAGTIAVLASAPGVWIGVQAAALLAVPVVIARHRRKRVEDA